MNGFELAEDLTVVVVVDRKTLPMAAVSIPTWLRYRPELNGCPWTVIHDDGDAAVHYRDVSSILRATGVTAEVELVPWRVPGAEYASQRERMLSAWVYAPLYVSTPWWLKIDADAVALRRCRWWWPDWFEPDEFGRHNVWIASGWNYTVGPTQPFELDNWADGLAYFHGTRRLDIPFDPAARTVAHPRMASWLSFYNTAWSRGVVRVVSESCGPGRIPVPSQDTLHWFVAERMGERRKCVKMKRFGWTNCPRWDGLVETARRAMEG